MLAMVTNIDFQDGAWGLILQYHKAVITILALDESQVLQKSFLVGKGSHEKKRFLMDFKMKKLVVSFKILVPFPVTKQWLK